MSQQHSSSRAPPKPHEPSEGSLEDVLSFISTLPLLALTPRASSANEERLLAQSERFLRILDDTPVHQTWQHIAQLDAVARPPSSADSVLSVSADGRALTTGAGSVPEGDLRPKPTSTAMRNKYRDRMKCEAAYLRGRASELEQELEALRRGGVLATSTSSSKNSVVMSAAWQRIAERQQQQRFASEVENRRLKRELRDHLTMTQCLRETLGKRPNTIAMDALAVSKRRGWSSKAENAALFKDLVDGLDVAFRRLDSVLASSGLDGVASEMAQTIQLKTLGKDEHGDAAPLVEICGAQVTPFSNSMAANASWWSTVEQFRQRRPGRVERVWYNNDDIVASKFRSEGEPAVLWSRVAVKKFFDNANRLVIVWRAHTECAGELTECAGELTEYVADETGWATFEPVAREPRLASVGAIARSCVQFVLRRKHSLAPALHLHGPVMGKFSELLMHVHAADMTELAKLMENLLMDEATGAAARGTVARVRE